MKLRRSIDSRAGYVIASLSLLLTMLASAAFPAFASAAGSLDSRGIELSSSASGAAGVSYDVKFTTENTIPSGGGLVVEFCGNTPIVGLACDTSSAVTPDFSSATLGTVVIDGTTESGATNKGTIAVSSVDSATGDNTVTWTVGSGAPVGAGKTVDITINNVTNPTLGGGVEAKTVYARLTSYTDTNLASFTDGADPGTFADEGGVAVGYVSAIGVTAYVEESMTFCVSGTLPAQTNCQDASDPSLTLGETVGAGKALDSGHVSTGTDYAELSTNASSGAVVNLKSDTTCGGLKRIGSSSCDIGAQTTTGGGTIAAGSPLFGLTVGSASGIGGGASGALEAANGSHYGPANYFLDYNSSTPTTAGITSPYGSPLLDSGSTPAPVNNKYVPITFGASISNTTPAGIYGATLHMTATGTF